MRWPNRKPHSLTPGMRRAQRSLAGFLPLIDWTRFRRRNLNDDLVVSGGPVSWFSCGDFHQAVIWLMRTAPIGRDGRLDRSCPALLSVSVPELAPGIIALSVGIPKRAASAAKNGAGIAGTDP